MEIPHLSWLERLVAYWDSPDPAGDAAFAQYRPNSTSSWWPTRAVWLA